MEARNLREDEIEALLKFDGMQLAVWETPQGFTAFISEGAKLVLAYAAPDRLAAVQQLWELYKERPTGEGLSTGGLDRVRMAIEAEVACRVIKNERKHSTNKESRNG